MNPIYDFKGQVALVTGAAKGMGLATARMFAESSASVVLADIDGDLAAKEAERIAREGGTAIGIACDVADASQSPTARDSATMSETCSGSRPKRVASFWTSDFGVPYMGTILNRYWVAGTAV